MFGTQCLFGRNASVVAPRGQKTQQTFPTMSFLSQGEWAGASVRSFYDRSVYRQCCQQGFFSILKQQSLVGLESLKVGKQLAL